MEIRIYGVPVEGKGKITAHGKTALKLAFPCGEVRLVKRAKLSAMLDVLDAAASGVEAEVSCSNAVRDPDAYGYRAEWSNLRLFWDGGRTFVKADNSGSTARFRFKDLRRAVETA